jgi:hypothetical protein
MFGQRVVRGCTAGQHGPHRFAQRSKAYISSVKKIQEIWIIKVANLNQKWYKNETFARGDPKFRFKQEICDQSLWKEG